MNRFFKETTHLGTGLVISGVAGLLFNIALGKLLTGAAYGVFQVFFSAVLLVGWIFAFGVERQVTADISRTDRDTETVIGTGFAAFLVVTGVFLAAALLAAPRLTSLFTTASVYVAFLAATPLFMLHRYFLGVLKGFREMGKVGWQNVFTGAAKLGIAAATFLWAWTVPRIATGIIAMFFATSTVSLYWLRGKVVQATLRLPTMMYWKNVGYATTKQIGEVVIRLGGPIAVTVLGGAALQAGIFGAILKLSIIPYYGYRALVQVILPEVSELHSLDDATGISERVSFLTESTLLFIVPWTVLGFYVAPPLLQVLFKPSFVISPVNAALVFFFSAVLLLSSLFTEVLIGVDGHKDIGYAWIIAVVPAALVSVFPGSAVTITSRVFSTYIASAALVLAWRLHRRGVQFQVTGFDHTVFTPPSRTQA